MEEELKISYPKIRAVFFSRELKVWVGGGGSWIGSCNNRTKIPGRGLETSLAVTNVL